MEMKGTHGAAGVIGRLVGHVPRVGSLAATAVLAAGALAAAVPLPAASAATQPVPPGLGGQNWTAIPTHAKVVALTFDAGANADGVRSILGTLARYHARATFFLTGNFVRDFPAQSKAIAAAGQRIGDHSVSHPYFTKLSDAQIRDQVLGAASQITSVTGADPWPWFRFPYGDYNQHAISVVNGTGFVPVGWTVDTLGWKGTSGGITTQTVVNRVLGSLRPGEIVLMHCGSNPDDHSTLDANALPGMIQSLQARGYSFVTIDALRGLGYHVLTSNGGVHNYGAPWYGSDCLPAARRGDRGRDRRRPGHRRLLGPQVRRRAWTNFHAPWQRVAGRPAPGRARPPRSPRTANGGYLGADLGRRGAQLRHAVVRAPTLGKLPAGVTAAGIAADPKTGGYWLLSRTAAVDSFNAPRSDRWQASCAAGRR